MKQLCGQPWVARVRIAAITPCSFPPAENEAISSWGSGSEPQTEQHKSDQFSKDYSAAAAALLTAEQVGEPVEHGDGNLLILVRCTVGEAEKLCESHVQEVELGTRQQPKK